jgi:hypothetical protein
MSFDSLKDEFPEYLGDRVQACGYHGCPVLLPNVRAFERHAIDVHGTTAKQIAKEISGQVLESVGLGQFKPLLDRETDIDKRMKAKWKKP